MSIIWLKKDREVERNMKKKIKKKKENFKIEKGKKKKKEGKAINSHS